MIRQQAPESTAINGHAAGQVFEDACPIKYRRMGVAAVLTTARKSIHRHTRCSLERHA